MSIPPRLQSFLDNATIAPAIFTLRPDYRALLVIVSNLTPSPSDAHSESRLAAAEATAASLLANNTQPASLPHIAAWREAYKAFGAKPNKTRNSLEALTRRVVVDHPTPSLPRVNRLTDIYNAVSVARQIPFGGEDLDRYSGAPRLLVADGTEAFETKAGGETVVERAERGEVVWCDGAGVTCRRWNWRQGSRTALSDETRNVLFILDALTPVTDVELHEAVDELVESLRVGSQEIGTARRLLAKPE